ncbi:MAG: MBL fold metallo-hydrolase [Peptococcaceae bacterium]|nr:MBL fold metallo-hydrolase [Peptococcaceae bacterium]
MNKQDIKIQYIYHSGFRIETEKHIFIFDYFQGQVVLGDKQTIVFSSHSHPDHYNPVIFSWQNDKPDIHYVLSHEISSVPKGVNVSFLSPYEEIVIGDVYIKAFGSTDLGVSFLVRCHGLSLFHAGDLNWWYWWRDIPEEITKAELLFKEEIAKMKGQKIDIAFFPVDQRLEHHYCTGADYFIQEIGPQYLVPMHFGDDLTTPVTYAEKMKDSPTKVIKITEEEQEILLSV